MALTVLNLVTLKAAAKLELLFNKSALDLTNFAILETLLNAIVVAAALAAPGATAAAAATAAKAAAAASYFAQNIYEIET
jgi:hypothetical protein